MSGNSLGLFTPFFTWPGHGIRTHRTHIWQR